jgi:N-acetylneuraminic acid mutarotase
MDPATTSVGGGAILMGGLDQSDVSVPDVIKATETGARKIAALPIALHDAAAATPSGQPILIGGGEPSHDEIWTISPTGSASLAGRLPAAASDVAAAAIGSTVYVVGGYTGETPLDTIVAWRGTGPGRVVGHIPHSLRYAAVAAAGSSLIIAGGTSGDQATRDVYAFDPATSALTRIGALPHSLTHAAAAYLNGRVYVIGGRRGVPGSQTDAVLSIDPSTGSVTPAGHLPMALSDTGVASLGGEILVAGGEERSGRLSQAIYVLR